MMKKVLQDLRTGSQKPGFFTKDALQPTDSVKNPVSLVAARKSCLRIKSSPGKLFMQTILVLYK